MSAEAKRKKAALDMVKKLTAAADATNAFLRTCRECNDGSGDYKTGAADGRTLLIASMMEYANHVESVFSKKGGAA